MIAPGRRDYEPGTIIVFVMGHTGPCLRGDGCIRAGHYPVNSAERYITPQVNWCCLVVVDDGNCDVQHFYQAVFVSRFAYNKMVQLDTFVHPADVLRSD